MTYGFQCNNPLFLNACATFPTHRLMSTQQGMDRDWNLPTGSRIQGPSVHLVPNFQGSTSFLRFSKLYGKSSSDKSAMRCRSTERSSGIVLWHDTQVWRWHKYWIRIRRLVDERLCVAALVKEVDAASRTENHGWIGTQRSAAIVLDPLRDDFSVNLAR